MSFWSVTVNLFSGFKTTLWLYALTLSISVPVGLVISFGSMSKVKPLRYLVKVIVWIVRGTPLMLQIFIVFYVPGLLFKAPISSRFNSAVIAFSFNYACYFSEIFRGGIQSISQSQYEAGQVLGMTKTQIFYHVVLLQVIKRILAPMSNEVITLVKDTALARVIMVVEILKEAEILAARGLLWPLFYSGLFYLIFNGLLTLIFMFAEKRLDYFKA